MNKIILCFVLTQLLFAKTLTIGSKAFSESIILSEILSQYLEQNHNYKIERKLNLGGTSVVFDALRTKGIDVYPDYTGTGYIMILKKSGERDPNKVYDIVNLEFEKQYGIIWSAPLGFNNTYAFALRDSDERLKNIHRVSDLKKISKELKLTSPHEFLEREDGYKAVKEFYELQFNDDEVVAMNSGLMYAAIRDNETDIIMSYSTDGRIGAYNLRLLKDNKNFFPPYYASYLTRKELIKNHPALQKAFDDLAGAITENEMIEMNDLVDRAKREPSQVAYNFLVSKGMIKGNLKQLKATNNFWQFLLSKKLYLLKILKEHLMLSFGALFLALFISLPTGILLTRYPNLSKIVFPFINTVQTIPSLALLGFLIPIIGIGIAPAIIALFLYSLLPLIRNTYSGVEGVSSQYIEASRGLGLTPMQILLRVEIPLALPIILAGIRTASVIVIGTATLAALVGAGGLGDPIFRGVATVNGDLIMLGAIPSALLAIIVDKFWGLIEKRIVSPGLRL